MRPQREVDRVVRRLKKGKTPPFPVEVKWATFRHFADTSFDRKRQVFVIRLSRGSIKTHCELVDTLMHEFAHVFSCYTWRFGYHTPEWGVTFARLYRAYHKER